MMGKLRTGAHTCTVIFPLIAYITPGDSSVYVGWANTVYGVLLAVMSPILGTVADYKGMKMKPFRFFLYRHRRWFAQALPFIDYRMALVIFVIAMVTMAPSFSMMRSSSMSVRRDGGQGVCGRMPGATSVLCRF
ncbi:MAG: hypothetical protein ACLVJ6_07300 [Merdibacter sp.]